MIQSASQFIHYYLLTFSYCFGCSIVINYDWDWSPDTTSNGCVFNMNAHISRDGKSGFVTSVVLPLNKICIVRVSKAKEPGDSPTTTHLLRTRTWSLKTMGLIHQQFLQTNLFINPEPLTKKSEFHQNVRLPKNKSYEHSGGLLGNIWVTIYF